MSYMYTGRVTEMQCDEFGIEQAATVKRPGNSVYIMCCFILSWSHLILIHNNICSITLAPLTSYNTEDQFVPPVLAKWLRPHQREGVLFMYECVMGLRNYEGHGYVFFFLDA